MTKPKTYYHNVPNSRYIGKDGTEYIFVGGQLTTDNEEVQADLDKQIANNNLMLRTKPLASVDPAALSAKVENEKKAVSAASLSALQLKPATQAAE